MTVIVSKLEVPEGSN